jgi:hypothetical protein
MSSIGSHREASLVNANARQLLINIAIRPDKLTNQRLSVNLTWYII